MCGQDPWNCTDWFPMTSPAWDFSICIWDILASLLWFIVVPNGHAWRRSEDLAVKERRETQYHLNITAITFRHLSWKTFVVLVVHMKSDRNNCVKKEKKELERLFFSPPHCWPITAWSGRECQIVSFRKVTKKAWDTALDAIWQSYKPFHGSRVAAWGVTR